MRLVCRIRGAELPFVCLELDCNETLVLMGAQYTKSKYTNACALRLF